MKRRVVVTGLGVVSSIGIGKEQFWGGIVSGKSGISKVTLFDTSSHEVHRGGEIKDFDPKKFIPQSKIKDIARASQFAVAASQMALKDAELNIDGKNAKKLAVLIGTTMGEGGMIEEIDKHWTSVGEEGVWGITILKYPSNVLSNNVARLLNLHGISWVIPTACSAGNYSIGFGYDIVRKGEFDCAIAGGADSFSRIGFTGFGRLFSMSSDACRPFDKDRKGMMLGEGAGILVLEELQHAQERGSNIYAEVLGYGLSCDAYNMTIPSVEGVTRVIKKAIKNSGININEVGYISAHGTGTPANDKTECNAIKKVFGELSRKIPISSIKSMLGHTMGAASAIEAISCCLAIKNGVIPPTINFQTPDPECDVDCVPNAPRKVKPKIVLNNSLAFGGNNACLVLGRYDE